MLSQAKFWCIVLLSTLLLVPTAALADWEDTDGPPVGVGTDIAISVDGGTEYIYITSGSDHYPYVSTNRGSSWDPMDNDPDAKDARCVTSDASNKDLIYIGKDGGVFKSTDGGTNFGKTGANQITNDDVIDLEMDPSSSNIVWCVSAWASNEDVLF